MAKKKPNARNIRAGQTIYIVYGRFVRELFLAGDVMPLPIDKYNPNRFQRIGFIKECIKKDGNKNFYAKSKKASKIARGE